jgi:hypothetical protein
LYARHVLSAGDREPENRDKSAFVTSLGAGAAAWSALGVAFDKFLRELPLDRRKARAEFEERCLAVAQDQFRRATGAGDGNATLLKARAIAETSLHRGLDHAVRTWSIRKPEGVKEQQQ